MEWLISVYFNLFLYFFKSIIFIGDLFGTFDELFWMSNFPTRRGFLTKTSYYGHILTKIVWLILIVIMPIYRFGFYSMFPIWVVYMISFS